MRKMKKKKVFVVGNAKYYADFLKEFIHVDKLEEANVVIFTGGEDVTPSIYGCKKHPRTYCNKFRDEEEKKIFEQIKENQLVLGICRGLRNVAHVKWGELLER